MDTTAQEAEIAIDRVFDAPLQLMWEVWSDPKHAQQWCAPHGCSYPVYEQEMRAGGTLRAHMMVPDGSLYRDEGVYEEVVPQHHFTRCSTVSFGDTTIFETRLTVTFEAVGEKTKLSVRQWFTKLTPEAGKGAEVGWAQTLDRLSAYLAR